MLEEEDGVTKGNEDNETIHSEEGSSDKQICTSYMANMALMLVKANVSSQNIFKKYEQIKQDFLGMIKTDHLVLTKH